MTPTGNPTPVGATKSQASKTRKGAKKTKAKAKTRTKTVAKTKTTSTRGRKPKVPSDVRITLLAKANPKRNGSKTYKRFALYKSGMTVGDFLKKGGTHGDVNWDSKHKYIKLS